MKLGVVGDFEPFKLSDKIKTDIRRELNICPGSPQETVVFKQFSSALGMYKAHLRAKHTMPPLEDVTESLATLKKKMKALLAQPIITQTDTSKLCAYLDKYSDGSSVKHRKKRLSNKSWEVDHKNWKKFVESTPQFTGYALLGGNEFHHQVRTLHEAADPHATLAGLLARVDRIRGKAGQHKFIEQSNLLKDISNIFKEQGIEPKLTQLEESSDRGRFESMVSTCINEVNQSLSVREINADRVHQICLELNLIK